MVKESAFYKRISAYFDKDSKDYDQRYESNPVLHHIRESFREETEGASFTEILEIGCGTGYDIDYFATQYPKARVSGIDVSPEMVRLATKKNKRHAHVTIKVGTPEVLGKLFGKRKFDLIYCYFGALNTVPDLKAIAKQLRTHLADDGVMVLTFINRWYAFDVLFGLLTLRPRFAFGRLSGAWAGYSPKRKLASTCRSPREIKRAFGDLFIMEKHHSYSILHPAWYRAHWPLAKGSVGHVLWKADDFLRKTPLRDLGEYSLYIFRPKS